MEDKRLKLNGLCEDSSFISFQGGESPTGICYSSFAVLEKVQFKEVIHIGSQVV
jgi:hypothetical protein